MIQISSGVLGAAAAALAFGAVHLEVAAGNDLLGPRGLVSQNSIQDAALRAYDYTAASVNRAAKSDRAVSEDRAGAPADAGMTLSFSLANVPATSILMRVPVKSAASQPSQEPAPLQIDGSQAKNIPPHGTARMVACEPPVSVLTPVARQLLPSRCVT